MHFLNRLIFCMFAEDAGLLPNKLFSRMMQAVEKQPEAASGQMRDLFDKMHKGGYFGEHKIDWFNGGLFDGEDGLPLEVVDLKEIAKTRTSTIGPRSIRPFSGLCSSKR